MTTLARHRSQDIWRSMCALPDTGFVPISEDEIRAFQTHTHAAPGQTAVDIGTGHGQWACQVARLGLRVTGYDRSGEAIKWARRFHEGHGHGPALRFEKHDATVGAIPSSLRPDSVDVVTFRHSLHLMDIPRLVTDIRRWLRPDGVLHVTAQVSRNRAVGLPDEQVRALADGWREHHQYTIDPHQQIVAVVLRGPDS